MTYQSKSQAKRIEIMKNAEQSDHEKLSRKLEGLWHDSFKAPGYAALRAVVELHKPHHGLTDGGADSDGVCLQCSGRKSEQFYPCPTIQAIEKEISDVRL